MISRCFRFLLRVGLPTLSLAALHCACPYWAWGVLTGFVGLLVVGLCLAGMVPEWFHERVVEAWLERLAGWRAKLMLLLFWVGLLLFTLSKLGDARPLWLGGLGCVAASGLCPTTLPPEPTRVQGPAGAAAPAPTPGPGPSPAPTPRPAAPPRLRTKEDLDAMYD